MEAGYREGGLRRKVNEAEPDDVPRAPWAFGVVCILLGAAAFLLASDIRSGFTDENDPGPGAIPRLLGVFLLAGGVIEVGRGIAAARSVAGASEPDRRWMTVLLATAMVVGYVVLLPLIGFALSTLLFAVGFLVWLGASWRFGLGLGIGVVVFVTFLFREGFHVELPSGGLGLPF